MEASAGCLEIWVNETEEFTFTYVKVADYENGTFILKEEFQDCGTDINELHNGAEMRKAAEIIARYETEKTTVKTEKQVARIDCLTEGVYLIEGIPEEGYEIPATLVSIPQWNKEEVSYHVTVIPKIQKTVNPVETGDPIDVVPLMMLCAVSLLIVLYISGKSYFIKDK